jgi:hypothetical protein
MTDRHCSVLRKDDGVVVVFDVGSGGGGHDALPEALLAAMGDDDVHVTFDFTDASADEGQPPWHQVLMPRRAQIKSLTIIAASPAVRISAMAMAGVIGVPVTLKTSKDPS